MKITVELNVLIALRLISGEDEAKLSLFHTLHVEVTPEKEVIFVASDGRRLVAILAGKLDDPPPDKTFCATFAIESGLLDKLIPQKGYHMVGMELSDGRVRIFALGITYEIPILKIEFPNWRSVLQLSNTIAPAHGRAALNLYLFGSVLQCAEIISNGNTGGMRLWQNSSLEPMRIEFTTTPNLIAILMPMKIDVPERDTLELPEWAN